MISKIGITNYNRPVNNINKKVSKPASAPKAISFGELDDCGNFNYRSSYTKHLDYKPKNSINRDRIEEEYNKRLHELADKADDLDMDNDVYYAQVRKIEQEKEDALYRFDSLFEDDF